MEQRIYGRLLRSDVWANNVRFWDGKAQKRLSLVFGGVWSQPYEPEEK